MFVGERMSHPVITVTPETPVHDALAMLKKENIRRAPVVKDGKLIGIVSASDLLNASPSPVTSLSVWEMNYLISKVTVKQVMSKKLVTVDVNTPIEEAARIMADNKIGGLPVVKGSRVVGIITETNLFKMFLELMGAREHGVRVTALIEDKPGMLAKLTKSIAEAGGNFIADIQTSSAGTIYAAEVNDLNNPAMIDLSEGTLYVSSFTAERVAAAPLTRYPMLINFDDRGRLFIAENAGVEGSIVVERVKAEGADLGIAWFEEPLHPDNLRDYILLRNSSPVPIAGGEVLTRRQSFSGS